jgi:DNA-binding response OmpR family regulator
VNASNDQSTILIIDDEPDNLRLAVEMLRNKGFEMVSARDGAAGLQIASRLRADLILLDVRMPGMDGFEVCRRLKANPLTQRIPVIFLTALDQFEDKARGFEAGGVDYVTKPFDSRELLLRVSNHLRLSREATGQPSDALPAPDQPTAAPGSGEERAQAIVLRARDFLLANLAKPPDLGALARHCASNRTSLQRLFKSYFQLTVFGYLREQRLQRARLLLGQGRQTIEDVAEAVGYQNGRDLARAFKQRFGVTPGTLSRGSAGLDPESPVGSDRGEV